MSRITRNHKGYRIGENHHNAKLSDEQVRQIRKEYVPYVFGYQSLAKKYGVSRSTICGIVTYRTRWNA